MRFIKFLILFVLAVLFGTVANAAETKKEVAPVNFAANGTWVGVVEDIQDIDSSKWAEFQTKWQLPTINKAIGNAVGYGVALATGQAMQVFNVTTLLDFSGYPRLRDDPRTFQISFKQTDGTVQNVVVHDQQQWEVGDKIKVTSDGVKIIVETIEIGELSRYAAEKAAARDK